MTVSVHSQNLTPEEQQKLLQDVKLLKDKVNTLEAEKKTSSGLKTTDYNSNTTVVATTPGPAPAPELTAEQMKEMMDSLQKAKSHQDEQQKTLKEIDNEDN